jgi:hypothetical protein
VGPLALAAAGVGLAGAALAVVATFSTVIKIVVLTVTPFTQTGYDRYGPALLVLAGFALLMIAGGVRGARPAMGALALAGVAVLLIAVLVDVPHIHDKGVWPLADQYEDAEASAGTGFYFETAAGILMLLGGALMLLLAPTAPRVRRERPAPRSREERRAEREARRSGDDQVGDQSDRGGAFASPGPAAERPAPDWLAETAATPPPPPPPSPPVDAAQRRAQPRRSGGLVGRLRGRDR